MYCPYCTHKETRVVETRENDSLEITRRRRECLKCEKRFTTYEYIETALKVIKRDGRKEDFDREKVKQGVLKACEKRSITNDAITNLLNRVEARLRRRTSVEVPSAVVGTIVLNELKKVDEVAYLRYASVYREFDTAQSFQKEVKLLLQHKR